MQNQNDRLTQLELLHLSTFGSQIEVILDSDRQLTHSDAENAAASLRPYLNEYTGPIEEHAFLEWAVPIAKTGATIHQWMREHASDIRKGIGAVLRNSADLITPGESVEDVIAELTQRTWIDILTRFDEFQKPSEKPMSHRLSGAAYWQARSWKTERLRHRERFDDDVDLRLVSIGAEHGQTILTDKQADSARPVRTAIKRYPVFRADEGPGSVCRS